MTEMIFSEGGQPIALDDLQQLYNNTLENLHLLAQLCGDGILTGCDIKTLGNHPTKISFSPGKVILDGEVYDFDGVDKMDFPGQGLADIPQTFYLVPTVSEERPLEFSDGSTHPTRLKRKVILAKELPTGKHLTLHLSSEKNIRPMIPRPTEEEALVTNYPIFRDKEQVGEMKLYRIKGLRGFRLCEMHIVHTYGTYTADEHSRMYRLVGSEQLFFHIPTVMGLATPSGYTLVISGGYIMLYKNDEPVREFTGLGFSALGIITSASLL